MNLNSFIAMRQEILLLLILLSLIVAEIFVKPIQKRKIIGFSMVLFMLHTIAGFCPIDDYNLFGGMFRTNPLVHLFKNILNIGLLIILLLSYDWIQEKIVPLNKGTEFFMLLFFSLLGLYFMISAGDFLMFYIGLELSTFPVAALVAWETSKRIATEAAVKFILSAGLASAISLFGVSLLYAATGSIYFEEVTTLLTLNPLPVLGFILFFCGLAFKISLVPFHFWTADVYEGAAITVGSYLSVISKGAAAFVLMILLFTVLKPLMIVWENIIYVLAIATMFIGNVFALRQKNLKRLLGYSSIAQAGFILLGLFSASQVGIATIVYFILIYIFTNLAAFGVIQAISINTNKERIDDYNGLYSTNPKLSLVMMLALFSLAGIPPVAGFFGKFFLFTAAASRGYYLLVFLSAINVTVSLYYYLLVVRAMFIRKNEDPIPYFQSKTALRLGLLIAVFGIIILGLYSPVYDYIFEVSSVIKQL